MAITKFRWSKVYESSEEELLDLFAASQLSAEQYEAEAFQKTEGLKTTQAMTLWCAEGSLRLSAGSVALSVQPGDAVRLPPQQTYEVQAGISGYTYYLTSAD